MTVESKKRCPDFAGILRRTPPTEAIREQVAACFREEMGRIARIRCRDDVLAEDATQEALLAGLTGLHTYRGDGPLEAWLRRLVVSACSRLRRGRINDPAFNRPLTEMTAGEEPVSTPPQELRVLLIERFAILSQVLADVSEPNRSLLLMHEGQDVPLADLAAKFELTEDGVKARLRRTRAWVRERLLAVAEEEPGG